MERLLQEKFIYESGKNNLSENLIFQVILEISLLYEYHLF